MTSAEGTAGRWADMLVAERAASSAFDPVTGALSLRGMSGSVAGSVQVTTVTVARTEPGTHEASGRFGCCDLEDRALSRALLPWAAAVGGMLAWIADGVAAIVIPRSSNPSRGSTVRAERAVPGLDQLHRRLRTGLAREPLVSVASGPSTQMWQVLARSVNGLAGRSQGGESASSWRLVPRMVRDGHTGEVIGRESRLLSGPCQMLGPDRGRLLTALTHASAVIDRAERRWERLPLGDSRQRLPPVLCEATALFRVRSRSPDRVDALLDALPPYFHLGVDAWAAAQLPGLLDQMAKVRAQGHTVVMTGYGSGREPLASLDELPVDAICLDPELECGALSSHADRAVRWALIEHATRHEVRVLSLLDTSLGRDWTPRAVTPEDASLPARVTQVLADSQAAGLTPSEAALLVNATRPGRFGECRWDRYRVALAWAGHPYSLPEL